MTPGKRDGLHNLSIHGLLASVASGLGFPIADKPFISGVGVSCTAFVDLAGIKVARIADPEIYYLATQVM
jgi:hypothetical protein